MAEFKIFSVVYNSCKTALNQAFQPADKAAQDRFEYAGSQEIYKIDVFGNARLRAAILWIVQRLMWYLNPILYPGLYPNPYQNILRLNPVSLSIDMMPRY